MRSSSLSKKAREEKAQHVPLWFWSLIEVIGVFLDDRELHGIVFRFVFLFLRDGARTEEAGCRGDEKNFLHLFNFCYNVINKCEFNR